MRLPVPADVSGPAGGQAELRECLSGFLLPRRVSPQIRHWVVYLSGGSYACPIRATPARRWK